VPEAVETNNDHRIVLAKPGLDGHDRGIRVVARALRDAGYEVIYLGLFGTPVGIARAVADEGADVVGLSLLSGAHLTLFRDLIAELEKVGRSDVLIFGGGVIPDEDVASLKAMGVAQIFTPGSSTQAITEWLDRALAERRALTGE
jgi:methylmalonyl-CoA mutase cobalamin-binding domain/chain